MKRNLTLLMLAAAIAFPGLAKAADIDWKKVDATLGKTAAVSGEVHRYGLPRSDLQVTLDGVAIKPALALGGWVAFAPVHGEAMVMGDLVLLDTAKLDEIIGVKGNAVGGVYQFGVPRRDPAMESGMQVNGPLGGANAINFQPTGNGKAAITGDFLVTGNEVNPLIRALRAGDIEVTAIHSHMLDEQPRMFFIHFWANDDAMKLARNVRTALDTTAIAKSQ